jgi:hypothetical protein
MEGHIPSLSKDVSEFLHPSRETPYLCQTIPERSVSEINTSKKLSDPRRCRLYSVRRRAVSLIASDSSCSVELTVIPPLSTLEVRSDDVHSRWSCQWSRSISRPVQSCGPDQPRDVPRRVTSNLPHFPLRDSSFRMYPLRRDLRWRTKKAIRRPIAHIGKVRTPELCRVVRRWDRVARRLGNAVASLAV